MEDKSPGCERKKRAHRTRQPRSSSPSSSSSSSSSTQSLSKTRGRVKKSASGSCLAGCTGQRCRACSAGLVADCVALCCCPLAAISLLALAFIKLPYAIGKCCLRRTKTTKKVSVPATEEDCVSREDIEFQLQVDGMVEHRRKSLCTGFLELDSVLLELYQVGHLGFGRLSFTGIQPNPKPI